MTHDVSQSISQGFGGKEDEETRRIQEITDELYRRCRLYETQLREGKADGDGRVELCDKVNNLLNSGGSVIHVIDVEIRKLQDL